MDAHEIPALIQCQAELSSIHNLHGDRANAEAHSLGLRMANAALSAADATNPQE